MIQSYTPNLGVGATRGWCLKYIDDAGNAPVRRPTAKSAFYAERDAGRIDGSIDSPIGVIVVGFLDFTVGPYTAEGHVFFMKNLGGGKYQIWDSEVGAGARQPYGSLDELTAWFGAYKPKYLGWSTHCDGREYARKGGIMQDQDISNIIHEIWQIPANSNNIRDYRGMNPLDFMYHILGNQTPYMDRKNRETNLAKENEALKARIKELEKMTEGEASKKLVALQKALSDVLQ